MQTVQIKHRFFVNMKWTLIAFILLLALGMTVFSKKSMAAPTAHIFSQSAQETPAYKQYQKQPKTEMAKINFIFNRFQKVPAKILYDSHEYEMPEALRMAKSFFFKHYKKESAEYWIQNYCYKTDNGNVIFMKLADGKKVPVRDVALGELRTLEKLG